jgi:hypothetical protein
MWSVSSIYKSMQVRITALGDVGVAKIVGLSAGWLTPG